MPYPIRHTTCGHVVMWFVGASTDPHQVLRAQDVVYLDGTQPQPYDAIPNCPSCGGEMGGPTLRICFDEAVGIVANPPTTAPG